MGFWHPAGSLRLPFPGVYLWRDPYGAIYFVDHTGTRRVPRAQQPDKSSILAARLRELAPAG